MQGKSVKILKTQKVFLIQLFVLIMFSGVNNVALANIKWKPSFVSIYNESLLFDNLNMNNSAAECFYHYQKNRFYNTTNYGMLVRYSISRQVRLGLLSGYAEIIPHIRTLESGVIDPITSVPLQISKNLYLIEHISIPVGNKKIGEERMNIGSGLVLKFINNSHHSLIALFKINFLQIEQYDWRKRR